MILPYVNLWLLFHRIPRLCARTSFIALVFMALVCPIPVGAGDIPSVSSMIESLKSSDIGLIRRSINDAIEADESSVQKRFILDLWKGNEGRYPDLPWEVINTPQVRVTLARALVPMAQRGADPITTDELAGYAWSVTESPDARIVREAFQIIGHLDRQTDVPEISRYLAEEERETFGGFYGAVWALAEMCSADSQELLSQFEQQESGMKRQEIISEARQYWGQQKELLNYCRYR